MAESVVKSPEELALMTAEERKEYDTSLIAYALYDKKREERGLKPLFPELKPKQDWLKFDGNKRLYQALTTASQARKWIPQEVERIRTLLAEAKTDTESDAREFQIWYVEKYLTRAAELAEARLEYFKNLSDFPQEIQKCKDDITHWFKYYAWGYDPRARTPLGDVPFELFPVQRDLVKWMDERVFFRRSSGLIEKSREEGATETIVRWGLFHWLNREGFSMLMSTRKEDEVDSKKNLNTLFERARFQIRLLPTWMLPEGFDVDKSMLSTMKLVNPANNNTILGEAPVENMGRGGRVTVVVPDEFAFWQFGGYPQFRSLSHTTDSIIIPSSVAGRLNQYADLAFDGITDKFVMDWRDNPFKDKRWYDSLPFGYISPKMSKTTIAQEVDRNYDAAQPGKVWTCPEPHVFITMSEFLSAFKDHRHAFVDDKGRFKLPDDWRVTRTSDYGQSEGHDWSYFIGAQPRANYPLSDTHFVFIAQNLEPTGLRTAQAVAQWRGIEHGLNLRELNGVWKHKPYASYISHEQDGKNHAAGEDSGLRTVLLEKYGEEWQAWVPNYATSIEKIQDWWTPVENDEPNPFRPEIYGRCKLVFVAPDDEYKLAFNERLNQWFVTISQTEAGFATCRKQIGAYHYPESELGKAVKAMRPVKQFDDIIDALRGYAVMWAREADPKTREEVIQDYIPEHLKKPRPYKHEDDLTFLFARKDAIRMAKEENAFEEDIQTFPV